MDEDEKAIKIVGYYNHGNSGDEQYKTTFLYLLKEFLKIPCTITFVDIDKFQSVKFLPSDIIILGGGDVINDYFMDRFIKKFNGTANKIIAVSIGVPYNSFVYTGKLNIFDHIFCRSLTDFSLLERIAPVTRVFDLSYFLTFENLETVLNVYHSEDSETLDSGYVYNNLNNVQKKKLCISLARTFWRKGSEKVYNIMIQDIASFINKVAIEYDYYVVFVPMNFSKNVHESDILIHTDVANLLTVDYYNITGKISIVETFKLFELFDVSIVSRYHACLFSVYKNVPFLPIFSSKKIENLLKDVKWDYFYKCKTDKNDCPIEVNENGLFSLFKCLLEDERSKTRQIISSNENLSLMYNYYKLKDIINSPGRVHKIVTTEEKVEETNSKISTYIDHLGLSLKSLDRSNGSSRDLHREVVNREIVNREEIVEHKEIRSTIVQMTSFYLTGLLVSEYNYGLSQKLFTKDFNYKEEFKWVINDHLYKETQIANRSEKGLFNILFPDYSNVHRSGWNYVYNAIKEYHDPKANLILDLYVDRTFHWSNRCCEYLGIVPYKKSWIGFIHHTFDTTFSEYNCENLFKNPNFLESLKECKGLFVLTKVLAEQMRNKLKIIDIFETPLCVPVFSLTHPTEMDVPTFEPVKFFKNKERRILHIGGWLRNVFSFYNLQELNITMNKEYSCTGGKVPINKAILIGKNNNNYVPSDTFNQNFQIFLEKESEIPESCICVWSHSDGSQNAYVCNHSTSCSHICLCSHNCVCSHNMDSHVPFHSNIRNNWYMKFYEDTIKKIESVEKIYQKDNYEYDDLLTKNIVFLNLIEPAAVNTLIECIVRHTPIIINRCPALEEVLGRYYPMFYDVLSDVPGLLSQKNIVKANRYLNNMNKKPFKIETFVREFISIVENL